MWLCLKAYLNEFDSRFIDGSVEAKGQYQLAIDVNTVIFQHHHLFSGEHVLASRLTKDYEEYLLRRQKKTVEYLGEKVHVCCKFWFNWLLLEVCVWLLYRYSVENDLYTVFF